MVKKQLIPLYSRDRGREGTEWRGKKRRRRVLGPGRGGSCQVVQHFGGLQQRVFVVLFVVNA